MTLPHQCTIDVTPDVPGLLFENARASMQLWEDIQSVEFRFKPAPGTAGTACCGWLHFWLAGFILADVQVTILVGDWARDVDEQILRANAKPYRCVFPSYSYQDAAVVDRLEIYAASIGDEYLRDVEKLRSGQLWNEELQSLIRQADVFQLFWSEKAAVSRYVEQEWRKALEECDTRPDPFFLRPVYWTKEPAPIPRELSHLHFAKAPLVDS